MPGFDQAILLYEVEYNGKSNIGDESLIYVKIYKASMSTQKYTKKLIFPVIKYFDR